MIPPAALPTEPPPDKTMPALSPVRAAGLPVMVPLLLTEPASLTAEPCALTIEPELPRVDPVPPPEIASESEEIVPLLRIDAAPPREIAFNDAVIAPLLVIDEPEAPEKFTTAQFTPLIVPEFVIETGPPVTAMPVSPIPRIVPPLFTVSPGP